MGDCEMIKIIVTFPHSRLWVVSYFTNLFNLLYKHQKNYASNLVCQHYTREITQHKNFEISK